MKPSPHAALGALALISLSLPNSTRAATPAADVESAVGFGSVYLDLTSLAGGYSSGGYTLSTNVADWGWPDGSDSNVSVDGNTDGTGDVMDDKGNAASDFIATVTGLGAGEMKDVYVVCVARTNAYDFAWGTTAGALTTVTNIPDTGILVTEGSGNDPNLYAQFLGSFTADGSGNLIVHLGKGGGGRTELDGLVLAPPPDPNAPISDFEITPNSILPGGTATLSWRISPNATSATIEPGGINALSSTGVDGTGSIPVSPDLPTTYTLTVDTPTSIDNEAQASVDVTLIASFTAAPDLIGAGEFSTLSWQVRTDSVVSIVPDPGPISTVDGIGSVQVSPASTTTYTLTATVDPDSENAAATVGVLGPPSVGAVYAPPAGGWDCRYEGDVLPTAVGWNHNNGSDEWEGSAPGQAGSAPGGAGVFTDGDDVFLRIQDTGDPTDYGFPDPSNRKVYFTKNLSNLLPGYDPLSDGVTLYFRTRLATPNGLPLDDLHPDGGAGATPWPGADGYALHNEGKGSFGVRQENGDSIISFAPSATGDLGGEGLTMNRLNGTAPASEVDTGSPTGTANLLSVATADWHDYWITITPDTSGGGTHRADIYLDGSATPTAFHLTAGIGNDHAHNYLAMGFGATDQSGAMDIDFFYATQGVHVPDDPTPFTILDVTYVPGVTPQVELTFPSKPGEEFAIERSPSGLPGWEELTDDFPAAVAPATTSTFIDDDVDGRPVMIYRVRRN